MDESRAQRAPTARGEAMQSRLVEATITSIAHDGLAGASIEKITRRAGVSRGLIRHYFGPKSNLLAEAFGRLAQDFREMLGMHLTEAPEDDRAAELRLRQSILPMFERLAPAPDRQYAWFGFWALARSDARIGQLNHELYEEIVEYLGGQVADVARRRGTPVDAAAAGRGLAAMMEGAWVHNIIGVEGMTVAEAQRLSLDYVARLLGGELAS